ncbi:MAG: DUF371 domain-containing protein [Candidatus Odinarchaeota archaeon]|nr:DUF371 domain-containing protein [Candidatus Odinarchaeota archaeon]
MSRFTFYARGHENIKATHKTTLEITKEDYLTPRGDCIVGVSADIGLNELPQEIKDKLRKDNSIVRLILEVDNQREIITGRGSPKLTLAHDTDMVCRKSDFTCPRTLMIHADKSASDLNREFIGKIKNPKKRIKVMIEVE